MSIRIRKKQTTVHLLGHILIARGAWVEQKEMQKIVMFVDCVEGEGLWGDAEAKAFP